jgi:hypothetical protein
MSMQDRLGAYPPLQLLSLGAGLSLTSVVVSKYYVYNFPLMASLLSHPRHDTQLKPSSLGW